MAGLGIDAIEFFEYLYSVVFLTDMNKESSGIWGLAHLKEIPATYKKKYSFPKWSKLMLINATGETKEDILEVLAYEYIVENKIQKQYVDDYLKKKKGRRLRSEIILKEMLGAIYAKKYKYAGVVYVTGRKVRPVACQILTFHTMDELLTNLKIEVPSFDYSEFDSLERVKPPKEPSEKKMETTHLEPLKIDSDKPFTIMWITPDNIMTRRELTKEREFNKLLSDLLKYPSKNKALQIQVYSGGSIKALYYYNQKEDGYDKDTFGPLVATTTG